MYESHGGHFIQQEAIAKRYIHAKGRTRNKYTKSIIANKIPPQHQSYMYKGMQLCRLWIDPQQTYASNISQQTFWQTNHQIKLANKLYDDSFIYPHFSFVIMGIKYWFYILKSCTRYIQDKYTAALYSTMSLLCLEQLLFARKWLIRMHCIRSNSVHSST